MPSSRPGENEGAAPPHPTRSHVGASPGFDSRLEAAPAASPTRVAVDATAPPPPASSEVAPRRRVGPELIDADDDDNDAPPPPHSAFAWVGDVEVEGADKPQSRGTRHFSPLSRRARANRATRGDETWERLVWGRSAAPYRDFGEDDDVGPPLPSSMVDDGAARWKSKLGGPNNETAEDDDDGPPLPPSMMAGAVSDDGEAARWKSKLREQKNETAEEPSEIGLAGDEYLSTPVPGGIDRYGINILDVGVDFAGSELRSGNGNRGGDDDGGDEESPPEDTDATGVSGSGSNARDTTLSSSTLPALRAWLVGETAQDDTPPHLEPRGPVYVAEPLPKLPFWKRYARGIMFAIVLFFVALTAGVATAVAPGPPPPPTNSPTPCPYPCNSCVLYAGPLLEEECDGCSPSLAMDGNVTVVAIRKDSIIFFEHVNGMIENTTAFGIDYKVGQKEGSGVAVSGNIAVVGSPTEDNYTGVVYVFEKDQSDNWTQTERIVPGDLGEGSQFGRYVDIDGDVLAVGSFDYTGSVRVFRRRNGTWVNETKLEPKLSMNKDFGGTVKVKGNRIAVADRLYGYDPEGVVFLYERDEASGSWNLNQPSDGILAERDCAGRFGVNLALAGDHDIMIGCPKENDWTGAVYYYAQLEAGSEYVLRQKISPSEGSGNRFGQSQQIAVDGNIMAIGEYTKLGGRAYVYVREDGNWTEVAKIDAPVETSPFFGDQVTLSADKVVVASADNAYSYDVKDCLAEYTTSAATTAALDSKQRNDTTKRKTKSPTSSPSTSLSSSASNSSTAPPSISPSNQPSKNPSESPSKGLSGSPSENPTALPSRTPSGSPSQIPTTPPSKFPTSPPSKGPTTLPSKDPSTIPSKSPIPAKPEPTSSPISSCTDTPNWTDLFDDGCEWYEANDFPGCALFGNDYEGDMGVANDNCCYCA